MPVYFVIQMDKFNVKCVVFIYLNNFVIIKKYKHLISGQFLNKYNTGLKKTCFTNVLGFPGRS